MRVTRDASNTLSTRIPNSGKVKSITRKSGRPSPISKTNYKKSEFPLAKKAGKR
jgi:hypothetical protein